MISKEEREEHKKFLKEEKKKDRELKKQLKKTKIKRIGVIR